VERIAIVGAGNMGSAIIRGLVESGKAKPEAVSVFDVDPDRVRCHESEFGITAVEDLHEVIGTHTTIVVLAVKPQIMAEVLDAITPLVHDDLLVISVAAGVTTGFILSRLGPTTRVIRAMPNAAAMVGRSATALCKAGAADEKDVEKALNLFSAVGHVVMVEEKMMNVVTALSGSGPAYVFIIMEALTDAGVRMGLDRVTARELAVHTVAGAAALARQGTPAFSELKDRVTSPGGTTIAGLHVLEKAGLRGILMDAVRAATLRGDELAPKE
jgi:pyrroline-5-carboxylate reductase